MRHRDVVVLGAGPAGLAAANACLSAGIECLVLEQGARLVERSPTDEGLISGVGGAGLFSDGKFSFFPSATMLWRLEPREVLENAHNCFSRLLSIADLRVEPVPDPKEAGANALKTSTGSSWKAYPSYYVSSEDRTRIIRELSDSIELRTGAKITSISLSATRPPSLVLSLARGGPTTTLGARALIVASGRFGPLLWSRSTTADKRVFRRVEFGCRIEQPVQSFFLQSHSATDPKLIIATSSGDIRTFCGIRDGETIVGRYEDLRTVSGRADCPSTGRSNIGLNVRVTDPSIGGTLWRDLSKAVASFGRPAVEPLAAFVRSGANSDVEKCIGVNGTAMLRHAIDSLVGHVGFDALSEAVLHVPCIEGVGDYPRVDSELRAPGLPVWVPGDASGMFRGLTAALVSGYFAGLRAANYVREGL